MPSDRYLRRIFSLSLLLLLVVAGGLLIAGFRPWARGVVLGGAASLANLLIMAADIRRRLAAAGRKEALGVLGRYSLRMTITAAALIYAAVNETIVLWGTIPALFSCQAVMTLDEMLSNKRGEASRNG